MTFKEYLKTPHAKKRIKAILKKRKRYALPQCNTSRHMDTSNMGTTGGLPAPQGAEQPAMS